MKDFLYICVVQDYPRNCKEDQLLFLQSLPQWGHLSEFKGLLLSFSFLPVTQLITEAFKSPAPALCSDSGLREAANTKQPSTVDW